MFTISNVLLRRKELKKKKKKELLSHTRTVEVGPSLSSPPLSPCALWFYASIKY